MSTRVKPILPKATTMPLNNAQTNKLMKIAAVFKSVALYAQRVILFGAVPLALAPASHAAQIQGVTIAAYSFQQNAAPPVLDSVTNLVASAGLFGDAHVSVPGGSMWYSGTGVPGTNFVTFNLGGVYTVNAMKVWNYNDASSAANANIGVSNASISYSTDGVHFTTNIVSQNFIRGQGLVNTLGLPFAQTITMPSPITAQYVRINVRTNWAANQTSGAGLSKVRFISNTNPPAVLSASENFGSNQITVVFSESVDVASATTLANYSINGSPAATISSVSMGEYTDRVILHTSPLSGNYSLAVSGVYDEALTATVTNNSSVPVQSELFLWLKAGQGVTTTPAYGGQMLTAWNDQSPYGHNALPANLFNFYTNQPFLVSSAINGQPAVAFYGTNVMQIPNDPANPINGDMTLFMVLVKTTTATVGEPISKTGGYGGGNNSNLYAAPFDFNFNNSGDGKPVFTFGNGNLSPNNLTSPSTITANTPLIVALSVTTTNMGSITVNGSQYIIGAFTAAPRDGGNPIYLGVRGDGLTTPSANTFSGYMAEVILIRGTITPGDFYNIDNYLSTKYSVPLNPPNIAEQPASVTAQAGQQATFWVNATNIYNTSTPGNVPAGNVPNGGGLFPLPFAYQWQSNGVAISGATNAVYTTPSLTMSANNASYTVTVSSTLGSGSVNSTAATLTVVPSTTPPTVASASKTANQTNILVVFSKAVDSGTGLNAANYSLNNGVSVVSAAAGSSPNQVILTTSTLNTTAAYSLTVQNVQDSFNNVMVAATVPVMPAGMTLWLRGDSGLVTNASAAYPGQSEVDAWLDQTGNGNNAVTYGVPAANRPWAGVDPANNGPAVIYTEANKDYMMVNNSPSIALAGNMTMYVVLNVTDFNNYREILGKNNGGFASPYELNLATGTGRIRFSRGDGVSPGSGTAQSGSVSPALNTPAVISAVGGPGPAVNAYLNGNTVAYSGNFSVPFADNGTPLYIGTRNSFDAALFIGGDIQEVMLFSNSISANDRFNVDNYFAAKYFTFTSTGPTNATANAGNTATFSVTASQGGAHFAYQWMETPAGSLTPTNIAGATNVTYTTGTLMAGDNGDTFSVVVTIPGTSSTYVLGPATLTVLDLPPQVVTVGQPIWTTNTILVIFQEPVNPAMATNVANYSLNNGATVLSALLRTPTEVYLTTSPLVPGTSYTLTIHGIQDQFGSTMTATNLPSAAYPSAPVLWLRAGAGITTNSDGTVAEWDDQSSNGNNFNNTGGYPFYPLLVNNAINGFPMVQFNGTNETYLGAASSQSLAITGDMAIFTVMKFTTFQNTNGADGGPGGGEIISKTDPTLLGIAAPYDYYVYYNSPYVPYFLRGNGQSGGTFFAGGSRNPTAGVPHILDVVMQGDIITHRLDAAPSGVLTWTGTPITDSGGPVYIGTRPDGGVRLTGGMAELLMFGTAVASNDVVSIENYLGTKYGLLTTPPMSLSLTNSAGTNTVVVSWPAQWPFVLQSTPSLNPAVWTTVSSPGTSTNAATVRIPATNSTVFYRLQYLTPP